MRALVGIVIVIVGVLAVVADILYLTEPAHPLLTFFPGHLARATGKHPNRGVAGVVVGAVVIVIGAAVALTGNRQRNLFR